MQFELHNIAYIIAKLAKADPTAPCVEQDGKTYSRADIVNAAQTLRAFFKSEGIGAGTAVGIVPVDRLRGIEAMIALWGLEASVLFLDPRQTINEMKMAQTKAMVKVVFSDAKNFAQRGSFELLPPRETLADCEIDLEVTAGSPDRDALILSTSGTTNFPRFRRSSHKAIVESFVASERLLKNETPLPAVSVGSLGFGAVSAHWIKQLIQGQFVLSLPLFYKLADLHEALCRKDIQFVGLPPIVIRDLLDFHSKSGLADDGPAYPNIVRMSCVGGPISHDDLLRAYQMLTPGVRNIYSMSGIGAVSSLSDREILAKPRSVGKPFPEVSVRIEDANGQMCDTGEVGHIVAHAMWKKGAAPIDTGDIGWLDDDGYLFVQGRSGQFACRNSINVNLADMQQDVNEAVGVRDCIAFLSQVDGSTDDLIFLAIESNCDPALVKKQVRSCLASYRQPDKIMVTPRLPRNASDKILLRELRDAVTEKDSQFVEF